MTTRRTAQGGATSWLARLLIWLVLVSVHTASFAQVVRPIIWGPHGAPQTGFTATGTFLQNGIITPNPHQGLHTLMNISVWTVNAFAMSNPADPNFVQPSLADMAAALNLTPQQAAAQINTLYVGSNPYANVNPPNANTASNMAAYDQILADYAALGGIAGTTDPQGSLSIFGPDALMNTPVFQAAVPNGQGAAGVIISESIESVQNSAAVANFNAIQIQNSALLGSPIYYSRHRMNLGDTGGNPNCIALGECSAGGAQQIHQNLFGPQSLYSGVELGYYLPGGPAHSFELGKNPHFATSFIGAGGSESGNFDPRTNTILAQNLAKATSQHIKGQQVAAGINFSAFDEDRALFMQGVDLYAHVTSPADRAILDALKSGRLKPGDPGYEAAQALAQRSFSRAWAQHVEYETSLVHNRESARYQAQRLQLQGTGDQALFQQGLNLYCKSCDAEQEEGLRKLAQGQLKEGDAGYQQARDLAEQRFKLAYENSLMPPPKKSWFKQLVAVVVAAVAAFFIGPAVSGWLSGVIPGATATSTAGATVIAGTSGTTLTVGGALASGIGSAVASTTSAFLSTSIATGSASQGLKAAGRALKGGLVTAAVGMVAPAIGFTNTESLANRSFSVVAQATGATVAGGGSFGQNLLSAGVSAGMQFAGAKVAGSIGDQYPSGTAFNYAGHAAWGCVSGAVAARSGSGCGSGAAGAVVGDWAGQQVHENLKGANPNGLLQGFANATGSIDGTAAFFAGMVGGATAAAVGKPDKVQQNFGIGQSGAENAFVNNFLSHQERTDLQKAEKECYLNGKQCDVVTALRNKDELSDKLLANAVATCEGAECAEVVNYIRKQAEQLGCPRVGSCPDQTKLNTFWQTAQTKVQGLEAVHPELWVLDGKAALDMGRWGLKAVTASTSRGSLEALEILGRTPVGVGAGRGALIDDAAAGAKNPLLADSIPRTGDRLVLNQGSAPTCGAYSCGMALDTMGRPVDVATLIQRIPPSVQGIYAEDVATLMKSEGVDALALGRRNISDLARYTEKGTPVVVRIADPGVSSFSHFVVVDGVTTRNGVRVVAIRDPHGEQYFSPVSTFNRNFTGEVIVPKPTKASSVDRK